MKQITRSLLCGCVLAFFAIAAPTAPSSPATMDSLKANLDLPYNAAGVDDEGEEAPGIVYLYGGVYEADAVVFCLDESKSMRKHNRWGLQVREVTRAVSELNARTAFNMVFYGRDAYSFREDLVSADGTQKMSAESYLTSRDLTLGTCLGPGVLMSLKMLQNVNSKYRAVIVAGDGRPTPCDVVRHMTDQEMAALIQQTVAANPGLAIRVHTIYVGTDNDPESIQFMRQLAAAHNGTFRAVSR